MAWPAPFWKRYPKRMQLRAWQATISVCALSLACASDPAGSDPAVNVSGGSSGNGSGAGSGAGGASNGGSSAQGGGMSGGGAALGGESSGGAAGTATGGGASTLVAPTEASGQYTFAYGDVVFAVDTKKGGRVVSFKKGTVELMDAGDGMNNYGSTLWPSPQAVWNWPPPAEIDGSPYTATLDGATLVLEGTVNPALQLSASKRFSVDSGLDHVEIVYGLKNESTTQATSVAPWEITRVDVGGLTFYPAPVDGTTSTNFPYEWDSTGQITWFDYAAQDEPGEQAVPGRRRVARACTSRRALAQKFGDIPSSSAAPGEAEIELYTNGSSYVEIENQGRTRLWPLARA